MAVKRSARNDAATSLHSSGLRQAESIYELQPRAYVDRLDANVNKFRAKNMQSLERARSNSRGSALKTLRDDPSQFKTFDYTRDYDAHSQRPAPEVKPRASSRKRYQVASLKKPSPATFNPYENQTSVASKSTKQLKNKSQLEQQIS